jgi:hypothetical protein
MTWGFVGDYLIGDDADMLDEEILFLSHSHATGRPHLTCVLNALTNVQIYCANSKTATELGLRLHNQLIPFKWDLLEQYFKNLESQAIIGFPNALDEFEYFLINEIRSSLLELGHESVSLLDDRAILEAFGFCDRLMDISHIYSKITEIVELILKTYPFLLNGSVNCLLPDYQKWVLSQLSLLSRYLFALDEALEQLRNQLWAVFGEQDTVVISPNLGRSLQEAFDGQAEERFALLARHASIEDLMGVDRSSLGLIHHYSL